jgi:hypothetical protein
MLTLYKDKEERPTRAPDFTEIRSNQGLRKVCTRSTVGKSQKKPQRDEADPLVSKSTVSQNKTTNLQRKKN